MNETSFNPADLAAMVEKSAAAAVEPVERTLERFLQVANVKSVYESPVEHGENMIIPAAEVLGAFGFGMGVGTGMGEAPGRQAGAEEAEGLEGEQMSLESSESGLRRRAEGSGGGGGGGGGGRVFARPVAVIISGQDGVRVEPVMDVTKIALAFFTTLGFMIGMVSRMRRAPSLEE